MTLTSFLLGMFVSFGLAWMFVIAIPVAKMGNLDPVKMTDEEDAAIYQRKFSGRVKNGAQIYACLLYTSPSPRDLSTSRMPSSA